MLASLLSGELFLNIPCWLHFQVGSFSYTSHAVFYLGSFSETSRAGFIFIQGVLDSFSFFSNLGSFLQTGAGFIFIWRVSLTHHMTALYFCGQFLLHIPCWGVSLTNPVLSFFILFLAEEFLLHIPCLLYFSVGSFSYMSLAGFFFFFKSGEFLFHILCWLHFSCGSFSYTSRAGFVFIRGVSLTHRMFAIFLCGEFLLHVPCWFLLLF